MKFENLNFLEPSGPLQDCNGTGLPFHILTLSRNDEYHVNSCSESSTLLKGYVHSLSSIILYGGKCRFFFLNMSTEFL